MSNAQKILIIGATWLGDMIMSQSLFKVLHSQGKTIDVLAPKWNHAILACMPDVNQAIELPFDHGEIKLFTRYKFAKLIKKNNYDECIVIPNSFKSALIPFLAGIPKRTGWLGESRYVLLNNQQKLNKQALPLMVQRLAALAYLDNNFNQQNFVDSPALYPNPRLYANSNIILNCLEKFKINKSNNILILAPGAAFGEAKKWPAEYFAKVANNKITQGWDVLLLGSAKDKTAVDLVYSKINNKDKAYNFAGLLELPETVAIISLAKAIVSNDSGLLHVAAALDIPLVGIYGSTSPDFTPPLIAQNKKVILSVNNLSCRPCFQKTCRYGHLKCLKDIIPEQVISAVDSLCGS